MNVTSISLWGDPSHLPRYSLVTVNKSPCPSLTIGRAHDMSWGHIYPLPRILIFSRIIIIIIISEYSLTFNFFLRKKGV